MTIYKNELNGDENRQLINVLPIYNAHLVIKRLASAPWLTAIG